MKQETLEKAIKLKKELDEVNEIFKAMNKEITHWWTFCAPGLTGIYKDGLIIADRFRKKIYEAAKESIKEIEDEIEQL